LNSEKWIQRFNSLQQLSFKNNSKTIGYKEILEKENFDILFFTHQRPPFIAPLVYQAEKLKIKTVSFINSHKVKSVENDFGQGNSNELFLQCLKKN
jgi:hypothetical protein